MKFKICFSITLVNIDERLVTFLIMIENILQTLLFIYSSATYLSAAVTP